MNNIDFEYVIMCLRILPQKNGHFWSFTLLEALKKMSFSNKNLITLEDDHVSNVNFIQ